MVPVNLEDSFARITEYWSPRVIGQVNDQYVKVAKLKGEFPWHKHADEDELFQVFRGELLLHFEDGAIARVRAGEFCVVPKGVLHHPVAAEECWVLLIETVTTRHTGDLVTEQTRSIEEQLA